MSLSEMVSMPGYYIVKVDKATGVKMYRQSRYYYAWTNNQADAWVFSKPSAEYEVNKMLETDAQWLKDKYDVVIENAYPGK